jgi:hypothetical protein
MDLSGVTGRGDTGVVGQLVTQFLRSLVAIYVPDGRLAAVQACGRSNQQGSSVDAGIIDCMC